MSCGSGAAREGRLDALGDGAELVRVLLDVGQLLVVHQLQIGYTQHTVTYTNTHAHTHTQTCAKVCVWF